MLVKGFIGCLAALVIAGCASTYVPEVPASANQAVAEYMKLPDNKVFVIAIDPSGDFAYGYADEKATLKEAAEEATLLCDQSRAKYNVVASPVIYAVNNKVVYEEMLKRVK
jgi:hypothetical protein